MSPEEVDEVYFCVEKPRFIPSLPAFASAAFYIQSYLRAMEPPFIKWINVYALQLISKYGTALKATEERVKELKSQQNKQ